MPPRHPFAVRDFRFYFVARLSATVAQTGMVIVIAWQVGAIAGPALGGYLYALAPHMPYAVGAALFILSLLCMFMIRPIPRTEMARRHPWQQMVDGLRYVRENKLVLGAISLDLF